MVYLLKQQKMFRIGKTRASDGENMFFDGENELSGVPFITNYLILFDLSILSLKFFQGIPLTCSKMNFFSIRFTP